MAKKIPVALNWREYQDREPVARTDGNRYLAPLNDENRALANPDNDREVREQDEYAGNDYSGPLPERISIIGITKRSPLYINEMGKARNDDEAARLALQTYLGKLEAGGPAALALLRAAASEGNKAILQSRDLGQGDNFTVVSSHRGGAAVAAALVAAALEMYPATKENVQAQKNAPDKQSEADFGKVLDNKMSMEESVRRTLARAKKSSAEITGVQKLPNDASKVDFQDLIARFTAMVPAIQTARIHPESVSKLLKNNLVYDKREGSDTFNKVIGLSDDLKSRVPAEHHDTIVEQYNSPRRNGALPINPDSIVGGDKLKKISSSRAIFCDSTETALAEAAFRNAKADEELVIGSRLAVLGKVPTKARVSTVHYQQASTTNLERLGMDSDSARYVRNAMQMIDHVDTIDMHFAKDPNKLNAFILGYASIKGKIGTITKDGEPMKLSEAQALGAANYISEAAAYRRTLSMGLDVEAIDPAAALALSLIHNEKDGRVPSKDIRAIQGLGDTSLLDVIEQAQTEDGARELQNQTRISSGTIRLMRDEQAIANAGRNLSHNLDLITKNGYQLLGREDFPSSLRDMENGPNFAIASGNIELLRLKGRVGIVGDALRSDNEEEAALGARIAPHLTEIDKNNLNRIWVHNATPFPIDPKAGDIVVVNGGLGVYQNEAERTKQDERDMAGALTLSFDTPISQETYMPARRGSKGKGEVVIVPNFGNDTTMPRTARSMAGIAERLVVTNGQDLSARSAAKSAIETHLRAGKRFLAIDPSTTGASPLTSAFLNTTGRKALINAGYGASWIEDPAFKPMEGGYAAIRMGQDPAKTAEGLKKLVETGNLDGRKVTRTRKRTQDVQE